MTMRGIISSSALIISNHTLILYIRNFPFYAKKLLQLQFYQLTVTIWISNWAIPFLYHTDMLLLVHLSRKRSRYCQLCHCGCLELSLIRHLRVWHLYSLLPRCHHLLSPSTVKAMVWYITNYHKGDLRFCGHDRHHILKISRLVSNVRKLVLHQNFPD